MTKKEVLALPAGRELDTLVFTHVMGGSGVILRGSQPVSVDAGCPVFIPEYSTNRLEIWQVVDRMMQNPFRIGPEFELLYGPEPNPDEEWVVVFGNRLHQESRMVEATGDTAALAICRCALLVALTKEDHGKLKSEIGIPGARRP